MYRGITVNEAELKSAARQNSRELGLSVKFGNQSHTNLSRPSSSRSRQRRSSKNKQPKKTMEEVEAEELERKEMHLPYWQRKEYKSYKHIKVLQPKLETPIDDYIRIKIEEQERRLVSGALQLKKNLKATDELPHNGIMSDMITMRSKRQPGGRSDGRMTTVQFSKNPSEREASPRLGSGSLVPP